MAFNSADWSIDYDNKKVTNDDSASGSNLPLAQGDYTYVGEMIEFFQWLATTFATTGQMDDEYPIQSDTPTVYKWLNGWTFGHANDFKYLKGGSIEDPVGSGTATADSLWSNIYSIGSQTDGTELYMVQDGAVISPSWWISGNIDVLVLVKDTGVWTQSDNTSGTPTDGGVWFYARETGDTFDHNFSDLSGGGRNPIGINTAVDGSNNSGELYVTVASGTNFTAGEFAKDTTTGAVGKILKVVGNDVYLNAVRGGTITSANTLVEYDDRECQTALNGSSVISSVTDVVAGYDPDFTETFGAITRDLNNGDGLQPYSVEVDGNGSNMKKFYEWLKYLTRYGSTTLVNSAQGQLYRSADEGVFSEVKVAPFGTLAGSTFYGAQGVWVTDYALADFVLIDDDGDQQNPPNYQKVDVSHPSLVGCSLLVAEISGGVVVKDQYTISTVSTNTITATASINANKAPQSGSLRIGDTVYAYTSFSGAVLSGVTPDPTGETGDFYIPLLDVTADATSELSDNVIYTTNFDVRTSVRKYGFKPYDVDTAFGASGLTFVPILSDDPQAT